MGAAVGCGFPLQGSCLVGFDFLGLHQIRGINFDGEVLPLKQRELGSNPRCPTKLVLALVVDAVVADTGMQVSPLNRRSVG